MNFVINKNIEEIAELVALSINRELKLNKNVLLFLSGGSAIPIEVLVSKKIKNRLSKRLIITLADERYGPINHINSNWYKLNNSGFDFHKAKLVPFITGKSFLLSTKDVKQKLTEELEKSDYKIGIFGIGEDCHTAGILPYSESVFVDDIISSYETPIFNRITITPKTISFLNEAFVYAFGESKWEALEKLKEESSIEEEPAQILKKVPLLTVFTDYNK